MKVLLYSGSLKIVNKSGIGQAVRQQEKTLKLLGIPYTMDSRDDYDTIHLNTIFPDSRIMSIWAKRKNKKVIYYAHSTMEDFKNSFRGSNLLAPIFKKWIIYCYNSADIVITPTEYSKMLLESYGLKRPIFSLSNGVDIDYFERNYDAHKRFRDKYNLNEQEKVIISVGHYIERKGILDFVKIAEQMPEYQFYWFGYTNSHLVPHSVREIIENSLPNLHFPGYVNRNDLRDAYCGSDLFLFLTHEETEGIVLLEALASKTPVLIRDIPVYTNWLSDGETVYKGITIHDFKEKITRILEGILPDITKSGYHIAEQRDLKVIGKLLMTIYDE